MVIGGGQVFAETLPTAKRLYLTWVNVEVTGADTFFPNLSFGQWTELSRTHHPADAKHMHAFDMVEYIRH
jgi:dihydrofolate reductase